MKALTKKEFIATRKLETSHEVEKRLGLMTGDVAGVSVYTYVDGMYYISVISGVGYQVCAREVKVFRSLKKAEKYLYKCLKEDQMEKEFSQGEIIEVVHEIASIIAACSSKWSKCRKVLQGNESMDQFIDENSTYERAELVTEMAREFLTDWHNLSQAEKEDRDFLQDVEYFCAIKFPSENKHQQLINEIDYISYLTIEFMSNLMGTENEVYQNLNGFCGATTKANELVATFKDEYKDVQWGENGFGSKVDELNHFLEREFGIAKKKEFQVIEKVMVTKYVNVEAYTEGEALDMAKTIIKNGDYKADDDYQLEFNATELK